MSIEEYVPTILVVDDEPDYLRTINQYLKGHKEKYNVINAPNGQKALELMDRKLPDLIICDWEMPVMDGISLIKQVKSDETTADIPVIMCTGVMTSSVNLETALEAGAVDYIRKPIDEIELIARVKANLHLASNYKRIKELNDFKDSVFRVIAHDLRGPVANIKEFLDLVLGRYAIFNAEQLQEYLQTLQKQSSHLLHILQNLLQWANSQRKSLSYQPVRQPIAPIIEENLKLLESNFTKKQIQIHYEPSDQVEGTFDKELISIVIRNLLSNAIKFTPENGEIRIKTSTENDVLEFSVSDTEVGIEEERKEKILGKTISRATYGTNHELGSGLGLMLCQDFIEQHGGVLELDSEKGKGSTFKFSLPQKPNSD